MPSPSVLTAVRIDKWLWAARFFKTRSLAKDAVESGKVWVQGERVKPSKNVVLGLELTITQGFDVKQVVVLGLSEQRKGAPEAALLYQETPQSLQQRQAKAAERQWQQQIDPQCQERPNKKQRRQIHRFRDILHSYLQGEG